MMADITCVFDEISMYDLMKHRASTGMFMMNIGSTDAAPGQYVEDADDDRSSSSGTDSHNFDDDNDGRFDGDDLDEFMASAMMAGKPGGVSPEHLSKIWRVSIPDAKRTIKTISQNSIRTQDPTLSRNYGTNDRMLRYKRINEYFLMDTFFAMKKGGKSSHDHTCCQLFVTDN